MDLDAGRATARAEAALACLQLIRSRRVGAVTYHRLLAEHGSAGAALAALPGIVRAAGLTECHVCPAEVARHEMRTHRSLWDEDLSACSLTLPKWGSMREGVLSELLTLERPTAANDAGLWPTPTVCGNYNRKGASANSGDGLATAVKAWPTPTASLGTKGGRVTPRKGREGGTLIEAVSQRTYATPTARDWRSGKASRATMERNSRPLSEQVGGSLNPTWVEWLMGWPLGWTDLRPLVTGRCRSAQQRHGGF